jgi:hypothetical protein
MSTPVMGQCALCEAPNPYTNINCHGCGSRLPWAEAVLGPAKASPVPEPDAPHVQTAPPPTEDFIRSLWSLPGACAIGAVLGAFTTAFYAFFFDITVESPPSTLFGHSVGGARVPHLSLIAERQSGMLMGAGVAIVCLTFYVLLTRKKKLHAPVASLSPSSR